jgi:hypothetical protein
MLGIPGEKASFSFRDKSRLRSSYTRTTRLLVGRDVRRTNAPSLCLDALRIPLVGGGTLAGRAAGRAVEGLAAALAVHASAGGSGRVGGSGSGGRGSGLLLVLDGGGVGGSRGGTGAGARVASGPDGRAGHGEGLDAAVDAEVGVLVAGLVGTGELDGGAGNAVAAASDLDLHTRDIVLRLVDVGAVDANVLEADEVLAAGGIGGDGGLHGVAVPGAPGVGGEVTALAADALLEDLEPVSGAVVGLDIVAGGARHVDQAGAGVLHGGADAQLDGDVGAGGNGQDLGLAGVGEGTLVADDIGAVNVRVVADIGGRVARELDGVEGRRAGGLADELVGAGRGTANDVDIEEVVGRGHLGEGTEDDGVLHLEGC